MDRANICERYYRVHHSLVKYFIRALMEAPTFRDRLTDRWRLLQLDILGVTPDGQVTRR
jgi:hypothetical protein